MTSGPIGIEDAGKGKKLYSANAHAEAGSRSGTGCSFCWFVLTLYPNLQGMTSRDAATYTAHLKKEHGLKDEIVA